MIVLVIVILIVIGVGIYFIFFKNPMPSTMLSQSTVSVNSLAVNSPFNKKL